MSTNTEARVFDLPAEADTEALGKSIALALEQPPLVIFLCGDLGAGKTTLARGILRGLGYAGKVVSPTYTLMEPYAAGGLNLLHLDLYRISAAEELEFLGLRDALDQSVLLIEWPEKGAGWLPAADLVVALASMSGGGRRASLTGCSRRGWQVVARADVAGAAPV